MVLACRSVPLLDSLFDLSATLVDESEELVYVFYLVLQLVSLLCRMDVSQVHFGHFFFQLLLRNSELLPFLLHRLYQSNIFFFHGVAFLINC